MVLFSGMRPQGNLEGMLTAQMVATHSAAMDFLSRATVEGLPSADRAQNLNHAMKLMSLYTRQIEVLDKHRGKGQQKVTVEYVNVESGGQAIVGHVEAGKGPKRRKGPAIQANEDTPEAPLEAPDPVTPQSTSQKTRRGR